MSVDGSNFLAFFNELIHEAQHTVLAGLSEGDFAPDGRNTSMVFAVALKDPIPPALREDGSNQIIQNYMATAIKVMHVGSFQQSLFLCLAAQTAAFTLVRSGLVCLKQQEGGAFEDIVAKIVEQHPELNDSVEDGLGEDLTSLAYAITIDMMTAIVECPQNH